MSICAKKKLNVKIGNALGIPYAENSFDGAYCSHLMHVFTTAEAIRLINELSRVVKPNGLIAITTVPFYSRFFIDPADVRLYPPEALRGMFSKPLLKGCGAPTVSGVTILTEESIWMRRPALFDLNFQESQKIFLLCQFLNQLQYVMCFRKYWSFNGYIMTLRNTK